MVILKKNNLMMIFSLFLLITLSLGWLDTQWHFRCQINVKNNNNFPVKEKIIKITGKQLNEACSSIYSSKESSIRLTGPKKTDIIPFKVVDYDISPHQSSRIDKRDPNWPGRYSSSGITHIWRQQQTALYSKNMIRLCIEASNNLDASVSMSICKQSSAQNCVSSTMKDFGVVGAAEICNDKCLGIKSKYCTSFKNYAIVKDENYLISIDSHGSIIKEAYLTSHTLPSGWRSGGDYTEERWVSPMSSTARYHIWIEQNPSDDDTFFDENDEIHFLATLSPQETKTFWVYFDTQDTDNYSSDSLGNKESFILLGDENGFFNGVGQVYYQYSFGDGGFGPPIRIEYFSSGLWGIGIGDFDNDNDYDYVLGSNSGYVRYYENVGFIESSLRSLFNLGKNIDTFPDNGYGYAIAVGHFNTDSNLDFVISGDSSTYVMFLGNGDGTFSKKAFSGIANGRGKGSGDFNGDGCLDLVGGVSLTSQIYLWRGKCDGTFYSPQDIIDMVSDGTFGLTTGDFDNDGNIDIVAGQNDLYTWYFIRGKGDGTFYPKRLLFVEQNRRTPMHAFDADSDGNLDIVSTNFDLEQSFYYRGKGDGTFYQRELIGHIDGNNLGGIAAPPHINKMIVSVKKQDEIGDSCNLDSHCSTGFCAQDFEMDLQKWCAPINSCIHTDAGTLNIYDTNEEFSPFYCNNGVWENQKKQNEECTHNAQCQSNNCVKDIVEGISICCPINCVSNGTCQVQGAMSDIYFCNGQEWEEQLPDHSKCSQNYQCQSNICARNTEGDFEQCCQIDCSLEGVCYTKGIRVDNIFCSKDSGWTNLLEDNSHCEDDYQCKNNRCLEGEGGNVCCSYPKCAHLKSCVEEGTQISSTQYCSGGKWYIVKTDACSADYECSTNSCVQDRDGTGRYCCITQCVFNNTCYSDPGVHVHNLYCSTSFKWETIKENGSPCVNDFECRSNLCQLDENNEKVCVPYQDCYFENKTYSSDAVHNLPNNHKDYCKGGYWYDCLTDEHCYDEGEHFWCTPTFSCLHPVCGNNRCEPDYGECVSSCPDCTLENCSLDGICSKKRGENCLNSLECECSANQRCLPNNTNSDSFGCINKTCDDGICDIDLDECMLGCPGCNATICVFDVKCNEKSGENCLTQTAQCACPTNMTCAPENPFSNDLGCYNPGCGNGVCEVDIGECEYRCSDCNETHCVGDGKCSFTNPLFFENCANSPDCSCTPGLNCLPDDKQADSFGCVNSRCGDLYCDVSELCSSCPDDCGKCLDVVFSEKKVILDIEKTSTLDLSITNNENRTNSYTIEIENTVLQAVPQPSIITIKKGETKTVKIRFVLLSGTLPLDVPKKVGVIIKENNKNASVIEEDISIQVEDLSALIPKLTPTPTIVITMTPTPTEMPSPTLTATLTPTLTLDIPSITEKANSSVSPLVSPTIEPAIAQPSPTENPNKEKALAKLASLKTDSSDTPDIKKHLDKASSYIEKEEYDKALIVLETIEDDIKKNANKKNDDENNYLIIILILIIIVLLLVLFKKDSKDDISIDKQTSYEQQQQWQQMPSQAEMSRQKRPLLQYKR